MKKNTFDELLSMYQNICDKQLNLVLATYQNLPEVELLQKKAAKTWNIAQCFEHLNYYARFYMPAIESALKKHSEKPDSGKEIFRSGWLGKYFTNSMNPKTGLKKIKAFEKFSPPENLNAHEVVQEFINHQETLLAILRNSRNKDLNRIRIPISIAPIIHLKLGDIFGFYIMHIERHLTQVERTLAEHENTELCKNNFYHNKIEI